MLVLDKTQRYNLSKHKKARKIKWEIGNLLRRNIGEFDRIAIGVLR